MVEGVEVQKKPASKRQAGEYRALVQARDKASFLKFLDDNIGVDFNAPFDSLDGADQDWIVSTMKDHIKAH